MSNKELNKNFLSGEYLLYKLFQLTGDDSSAEILLELQKNKNIKKKIDEIEEEKIYKELYKELYLNEQDISIPSEVIDNIKSYIIKKNIELNQITNKQIKKILKNLNYTIYYENIEFIRYKLGIHQFIN